MAFGWPSMFWQLDPDLVIGGADAYDRAIRDASDEYKSHFVRQHPFVYTATLA